MGGAYLSAAAAEGLDARRASFPGGGAAYPSECTRPTTPFPPDSRSCPRETAAETFQHHTKFTNNI